MNGFTYQILRLLQIGKENAITGRKLASKLGLKEDRSVREGIRSLIADGWPVASSVDGNKGYFIANTAAEADEYLADLKSRLVQDAYRRRDFKKAAKLMREPHQVPMFFRMKETHG
jgi:biotin operon repressor